HQMRIVHAYPEHTQHGKNMAFFKEEAEAYTDGRLKVTVYPNAQLGPITQEASMVLSGTVEATYNLGGILEGVDPAEAIWNVPFLVKVAPGKGEHMRRMMYDETINEILSRRFAERGFMRLGHIPTLTGFMLVANNVRPVEKVEDMKGLRIRHPGGLMGELYISSLGASPMTVAGAEVPVALQQGVVDGLVTTPIHYHDARWHTKYMSLPFYAGYGLPFAASMRWWKSLPKDIQDILLNKVIPETQKFAYDAVIELENQYVKDIQAAPYNVSITWVSAQEMEKFTAMVREPAIKRFVEKVGPDGQKLVDQVLRLGEDISVDR
ncbi:MAG: TRAP transporter substrate-binding protein, partial [Gemmatimonadales bacterium]|nr:TRAP transporter substrate-binding protein [Gemmatimonadales bacterium]